MQNAELWLIFDYSRKSSSHCISEFCNYLLDDLHFIILLYLTICFPIL